MTQSLAQLLETPHHLRILVVGDVMLDRYLWGNVDRISYEAPIPVVRMDKREDQLGGAGSVVAILSALGVETSLASVVGDDPEGQIVHRLLEEMEVRSDATLVARNRLTTVKERLLGRTQSRHPQQVIRLDREDTHALSDELTGQLSQSIAQTLEHVDLVLVSDYGKGACDGQLVPQLVSAARQRGIRVVADPTRGVNYERYAGCTAITPNRNETENVLGRKIVDPHDGVDAARQLLAFGIDTAVVTLDRDGIAWADSEGRGGLIPVVQRQVYDVTGAGDAVLGALGYGLAAGCDWPEAIALANLAGSLEVQRLGVVPFGRRELLAELSLDQTAPDDKIVTVDQLQSRLIEHRQRGAQIVMTNGCFDLLHPGHIAALQYARRQGDCLVVGVNSDRSVEELKGNGRPVIDQQGRADMLAALACVAYVVVFDETSVAGLVEQIKPDILVKSAEYTPEQVVGHDIVRRHGGRVVLAPMAETYSTSRLIEKIRNVAD